MLKKVTLYIEDCVIARANALAVYSQRELEDILADWIARYSENIPIEMLPDDEVLWLCGYELNPADRHELMSLLACHRDCDLDDAAMARLDTLLERHRKGLIQKSRALHVAVERGLLPEVS